MKLNFLYPHNESDKYIEKIEVDIKNAEKQMHFSDLFHFTGEKVPPGYIKSAVLCSAIYVVVTTDLFMYI